MIHSGQHTSLCIKSGSTARSPWIWAKHGYHGLCFMSLRVASTSFSLSLQGFAVAMPATYTTRNPQSMSSNFRTTRQRPHIGRDSGTGSSNRLLRLWELTQYMKHLGQAACLTRTKRTCVAGPCTRPGRRCLLRLEPICRARRV